MALYSMGVQLLMLVARGGLSGENSIGQTLSFAFPTDQFYDLVCTYKNLVAGFVGVCMSLVNTLASWESQVCSSLRKSYSPQSHSCPPPSAPLLRRLSLTP